MIEETLGVLSAIGGRGVNRRRPTQATDSAAFKRINIISELFIETF